MHCLANKFATSYAPDAKSIFSCITSSTTLISVLRIIQPGHSADNVGYEAGRRP